MEEVRVHSREAKSNYRTKALGKNQRYDLFEMLPPTLRLQCCTFEHALSEHLNHKPPISIGIADEGGSGNSLGHRRLEMRDP